MRDLTKKRKEAIALDTRLKTGGHKRTRPQKTHDWSNKVIRGDVYGYPARTIDEVSYLS